MDAAAAHEGRKVLLIPIAPSLPPRRLNFLSGRPPLLGWRPFEVVEVSDVGAEFYAHLRFNRSSDVLRPANYKGTRDNLLRRILDEAAETSMKYQEMRSVLEDMSDGSKTIQQGESADEANRTIRQLKDTAQRLAADNVYERQLNKSIRGSLTWKLVSPFWRLETRKARKRNRLSSLE